MDTSRDTIGRTLARCMTIRPSITVVFALFMLLACAYLFVMLHKPWDLRPGAAHDDALYVGLARSLLNGEWLGVYNDRTLAKPPGFSFFIALAALSGLPFNIAVGLFNGSISVFFSWAVWRLSLSRLAALLAFGLVLFSPQYFMLNRVLREDIYCYQFMLFLGLLICWMTDCRGYRWIAAAGVAFGWLWITREDGIWLLPGVLVWLLLDQHRRLVRLKGALLFLLAAVLLPVGLGLMNRAHYGRWAVAEINDAAFVKAISATQSVRDGGRIPGVAVTKAARQMLYDVSPALATLRPVIEAPGYFDFACSIAANRCGEIGNGWWHWAVRYAAWQRGHHQSPAEAAAFYKQVRADIEGACKRGALHCDWRPIAALPTMSWNDVVQMPGYGFEIMRTALTADPSALTASSSEGEQAALGAMFKILNGPPIFESSDFKSSFLKGTDEYRSSIDFSFLKTLLGIYHALLILLELVTIILALCCLLLSRRMQFGTAERVCVVILTYAFSRIGLLSIIGVTSFTTDNAMYIGPVYHLLAIFVLLVLVLAWRRVVSIIVPKMIREQVSLPFV
ncbi:glycosyltransferase family 39 protein [Lichenihabitans sp. Uapishka_5]|uniref:glycosyltransferase family 39 protein n=1 Tax=Lichenihabitans sp. Uapishka_5 TaxID=3037302 RepID=UPI0029E7FA6A|nr:glycosyltransferase family 39 protein [Lichenihabitans sp. Uapishka_5]MDX7952945.1 glycosyltransferase family 39 protein [Lichenihabitans sp. Uapishka_5]